MALTFSSPIDELAGMEELKKDLSAGRGPIGVTGCVDSQKIHLACELTADIPQRLIITYNEVRAREILEDAALFDENVWLYPAKDVLFYQADVQGNQLSRERMSVLRRILEKQPGIVVTTVDGCMDRIAAPEDVYRRVIRIRPEDILDLEELREQLTDLGYERQYQVENAGQFSIRGGIVDIYPLTEENPVRIEFWGDEVDSIRSFECDSQRSLESLDEVCIYAANEMPEVSPEGRKVRSVSLLDYFDDKAVLLLDEPVRLEEKAEGVFKEFSESMVLRLEQKAFGTGDVPELLEPKDVFRRMSRGKTLLFSGLGQRSAGFRPVRSYSFDGKTVFGYEGHMENLVADLKGWMKEKYRVVLLTASRTKAERLAGSLREDYELPTLFSDDPETKVEPGQVLLTNGSLHRSFEYPAIRFIVISEGDVFGKAVKKRRKNSQYSGSAITSFADLKPGDYVVEEEHGLGVYRGIETMTDDGVTEDYLKISYREGGTLYIPVTRMNQVQKYASGDTENPPKLNRLGGADWKRTRTKVKGAVKDIAADLVRLYAARQDGKGFSYGPDTVWQKEFEEQFPFEETEDQRKAIEAVKKDMENGKIMDRLICGDVGYGKTEIAIRAAFKTVQESRQVAYLVPTTILAQQHYNTFCQRMKDYPVKVELLCRFRTASQQKKVIEKLRTGEVDIVIGTHRLLSKDVAFRELGLLIIDEEQRFGVADKEKIKQVRQNVNVLSMTATPIPRTLHMSMVGIRDISILEEPPLDRQPIQTYVMEYNAELVREAIQRELDRGGQVYYVYNQIKDIETVTNEIQALVPDANVVYAHGQMKERELEQIMLDFINREIDVLVSTTIIETGLDISNTNTIIIHDADRYGLAQLYQLRGRVGRSNRSAYAFLMYRRNRMLKEQAEKRLQAIREYTALGSGIRIAMRDLELRGAGNVLGAEQHGQMEAVGYDLYCKLLREAVQEVRGTRRAEDFDTTIDLKIDAYIPADYISNESQRMDIYKRIARIETEEDLQEMQDELIDRFGTPPIAVQNLILVSRLRTMAHEVYVTEIGGTPENLRFTMYGKAPVKVERIQPFLSKYYGNMRVKPDTNPVFIYHDFRKENTSAERTLETVKKLLTEINGLIED